MDVTEARQWLNDNPRIVGGVAAGSVVVAVVLTTCTLTGGPPAADLPTQHWYWDPAGQTLFAAPADSVPPLPSDADHPGALRARVYSCGDCSDQSQRFVAFYEFYTPDGRTAAQELASGAPSDRLEDLELQRGEGLRYQNAETGEVIAADDENAAEVVNRPDERCGQGKAVECFPPE